MLRKQIILCVLVLFAAVSNAADTLETEVSGQVRKIPYGIYGPPGAFLLHAGFGIVAALVIVKLVLGMVFVGMVTALLHMFGGIKYLLKINEVKQVEVPHEHEHEHYSIPTIYQDHEPFHGYEHTGPGPEYSEHPYKRRQDLDGARSLRGIEDLSADNDNGSVRQRRKRSSLKFFDNNGSPKMLNRLARSVENENCKKKIICELHAKAKQGPFETFQLYFVKKDGLAKYWDHNENRKFSDCARDFPCDKEIQSTAEKRIDSVAPIQKQQARPPTARSLTAEGRQNGDYGVDYSSNEYETENVYQPDQPDQPDSGYQPDDYSQAY